MVTINYEMNKVMADIFITMVNMTFQSQLKWVFLDLMAMGIQW